MPLECDDRIACTIDDCDPLRGCVFTPDDRACPDGRTCDATLGCV